MQLRRIRNRPLSRRNTCPIDEALSPAARACAADRYLNPGLADSPWATRFRPLRGLGRALSATSSNHLLSPAARACAAGRYLNPGLADSPWATRFRPLRGLLAPWAAHSVGCSLRGLLAPWGAAPRRPRLRLSNQPLSAAANYGCRGLASTLVDPESSWAIRSEPVRRCRSR